MVKNLPASAGDLGDAGLNRGSGRYTREGHVNSPQYSCLENPMKKEPGGLQPMGSQRAGHG